MDAGILGVTTALAESFEPLLLSLSAHYQEDLLGPHDGAYPHSHGVPRHLRLRGEKPGIRLDGISGKLHHMGVKTKCSSGSLKPI